MRTTGLTSSNKSCSRRLWLPLSCHVDVPVSSKLELDLALGPLQRARTTDPSRGASNHKTFCLSASAIATVCTPNSRLSRAIWPRFSLRDGIPASARTSDAATLSFCRSGAARSSVGGRHSVNGVRRCTATTAGAGRTRLARLVGGADATALRAVAWETRRQSEQEDRSTTASSAGQDGLIQSSSNARHAEESTVRRLSMPRHCSGQHLQRVNGSSIALAQCDPAPGAPRFAVLAFRGRASQLGCHCDKAAHSALPLSSAAWLKRSWRVRQRLASSRPASVRRSARVHSNGLRLDGCGPSLRPASASRFARPARPRSLVLALATRSTGLCLDRFGTRFARPARSRSLHSGTGQLGWEVWPGPTLQPARVPIPGHRVVDAA